LPISAGDLRHHARHLAHQTHLFGQCEGIQEGLIGGVEFPGSSVRLSETLKPDLHRARVAQVASELDRTAMELDGIADPALHRCDPRLELEVPGPHEMVAEPGKDRVSLFEKTRSGRVRSFNLCWPMSRTVTPAGNWSWTSSQVGPGHDRLPAMGDRPDSRSPVNRGSVVVVQLQVCCAGMQ